MVSMVTFITMVIGCWLVVKGDNLGSSSLIFREVWGWVVARSSVECQNLEQEKVAMNMFQNYRLYIQIKGWSLSMENIQRSVFKGS